MLGNELKISPFFKTARRNGSRRLYVFLTEMVNLLKKWIVTSVYLKPLQMRETLKKTEEKLLGRRKCSDSWFSRQIIQRWKLGISLSKGVATAAIQTKTRSPTFHLKEASSRRSKKRHKSLRNCAADESRWGLRHERHSPSTRWQETYGYELSRNSAASGRNTLIQGCWEFKRAQCFKLCDTRLMKWWNFV